MTAAPVTLVRVDDSILSSYGKKGTGGPRNECQKLNGMKMGVCHPEAAPAVLALCNGILAAGGDPRITEMHRDIAVQAAARAKYDRWLAAGAPKPYIEGKANPAFDSKTMKSDKVAMPGRSVHNAGRAVDVDTGALKFPVAANLQLDKLWEICKPLGWSPIIKEAKEGASESWHLDYWGELTGVLRRLGYEQAALCGAILVGHGDLTNYDATIQALLCRAGFDIGKIDGQAGPRTTGALGIALNCVSSTASAFLARESASIFPTLLALPAK